MSVFFFCIILLSLPHARMKHSYRLIPHSRIPVPLIILFFFCSYTLHMYIVCTRPSLLDGAGFIIAFIVRFLSCKKIVVCLDQSMKKPPAVPLLYVARSWIWKNTSAVFPWTKSPDMIRWSGESFRFVSLDFRRTDEFGESRDSNRCAQVFAEKFSLASPEILSRVEPLVAYRSSVNVV